MSSSVRAVAVSAPPASSAVARPMIFPGQDQPSMLPRAHVVSTITRQGRLMNNS